MQIWKSRRRTLETERLKRNEYRARHGLLYHKFHARHGVHTDILKDSSTPWTKGVAAAGRPTNRGWVIRRYEGMQRVEGRTQSGLHFSCRGRPGSYWKYLHVIYGAHMLQEPNAPPLLPSPSFTCSYSLPPFTQTPFSASFPLRLRLPFSVLRNGRLLLFLSFSFFHSSPSSVHESLRNLPATSREFYKTFHASLTASASFSQTKQRILVWIEFLMEPTPPGPRPPYPSIHPSPFLHVYGARASSMNCVKASRRLPLSISISSSTRYDFEQSGKGCI